MKKLSQVFGICLLIATMSSCFTNDELVMMAQYWREDEETGECIFIQSDELLEGVISDEERQVMEDCTASRMQNKADVQANLIGEWELIGFATFWEPRYSNPCAKLTFTETEVTIEYAHVFIDTIKTLPYEIVEYDDFLGTTPELRLESEDRNGILYINRFCENYIFGDGTGWDGWMHIYQKVQ